MCLLPCISKRLRRLATKLVRIRAGASSLSQPPQAATASSRSRRHPGRTGLRARVIFHRSSFRAFGREVGAIFRPTRVRNSEKLLNGRVQGNTSQADASRIKCTNNLSLSERLQPGGPGSNLSLPLGMVRFSSEQLLTALPKNPLSRNVSISSPVRSGRYPAARPLGSDGRPYGSWLRGSGGARGPPPSV